MEKLENSRNLWDLSGCWVEGLVSAPRSELSEPTEASAPTSGKQSQAIHSLHFPPKHQKHLKLPRPGPEEAWARGMGHCVALLTAWRAGELPTTWLQAKRPDHGHRTTLSLSGVWLAARGRPRRPPSPWPLPRAVGDPCPCPDLRFLKSSRDTKDVFPEVRAAV